MGASNRFTHAQRQQYLDMTNRIGRRWIEVFEGDTEFYSAAYWDLLTGIWYRGGAVRKTDALGLMTAIKSAHTAGKHVDVAISRGILEEKPNPEDARSRLIALSPEMRRRLDAFFDQALVEVEDTGRGLGARRRGAPSHQPRA
jgi:hypothetical protein